MICYIYIILYGYNVNSDDDVELYAVGDHDGSRAGKELKGFCPFLKDSRRIFSVY